LMGDSPAPLIATPALELEAFLTVSSELLESAWPSLALNESYAKPGLIDILETSNWAEGKVPDPVKASYLLFLTTLPKRSLTDDLKNLISKLIEKSKTDAEEFVRLAATMSEVLMEDKTFLTSEQYAHLESTCPKFRQILQDFKSKVLSKDPPELAPNTRFLSLTRAQKLMPSGKSVDELFPQFNYVKGSVPVPDDPERLKKYLEKKDSISPLVEANTGTSLASSSASPFLRHNTGRAKLGLNTQKRRNTVGVPSPVASSAGGGYKRENRMQILEDNALTKIYGAQDEAAKKIQDEKDRKKEEKLRLEEERRQKRQKADDERRKRLEEKKAAAEAKRRASSSSEKRKNDGDHPSSPSAKKSTTESRNHRVSESSPLASPTLTSTVMYAEPSAIQQSPQQPHLPLQHPQNTANMSHPMLEQPPLPQHLQQQTIPPQAQPPLPQHLQQQSIPPQAQPLQSTIWNEINRLTKENRKLIQDFISGNYVKSDTKALILMNRMEITHKNSPHYESLYMELNYEECRWRKIRKKKKITDADRAMDEGDLAMYLG